MSSSETLHGLVDHNVSIPVVNANQTAVSVFLTNKLFITTGAVLVISLLANYLFTPSSDPREPPLLKPRIPFIGHLVGIIRYQNEYFNRLGKRGGMSIASVPVFGSKLYAIWDTNLIQTAFRNKDLSFVPFIVYVPREVDQGDVPKKTQDNHLMLDFFKAVHEGMSSHFTTQMNATALKYISGQLGEIQDEGVVIDNAYTWVRDLMTMATCEALYGPGNPMKKQPSLVDDLWIFDEDLPLLLLGIFPSYTAPKGLKARQRLETALGEYYDGNEDAKDGVPGITHMRATAIRKFVATGAKVGVHELSLLHVATSNAIPTLFWFFAHVFTRPELVERVRTEVLAMVGRDSSDEVTINLDAIAERCPLLVSCYREAIRLCNKAVSNRIVMADTTISDGKGRSYLLKEGTNVQIPLDHLHIQEEAWGADFAEFSAERFLQADSAKAKARRAAYAPFGGGKHLCPGRNFAFGENLGFMVSFLLSFEVSPADGNWGTFKVPPMARCTIADAVCKPEHDGAGFGIRVKRRQGWKSTSFRFTSGGVDITNI